MSVSELYCTGARVWLPDDHQVWSAGIILTPPQDGGMVVGREGGGEEKVEVGEGALPPLCNPDVLVGANDLTTLSYLHEPAVLHNLQVRFLDYNTIYTYCGIVLVAINPYQSLPIYGSDIVSQYSGRQLGEMDPHVFAVAEEAYRTMAREGTNQSIIVSGESGAGKTVSAKYAMRYFAEVGGASVETQIERKVLASNPIMEAIGNAKTTRNDNSSRFGKYIEIAFDKHHLITGASMRTYLLEKSRVVSQATEERSYHIFYQLCASRNEPGMEEFGLGTAEEFFYTSQGGEVSVDGVDDRLEFSKMREALHTLGFSDDQQMGMCQVLAAILHIGNIEPMARSGDDACQIDQSDSSLETAARLLGVDRKALHKWLSNRRIATAKEVYTKPLTSLQAINARDGLAKLLYARLFEWVVSCLNHALGSSEKRHSFIGVLDIYGFEVFLVNSFEQFCINYANEKLQQQFNTHVFKLEQQEYMKEAIQWSFISFHDNQPCIDLIESKLGVLDLLDETCRMPRACDNLLIQKLYSSHKDKDAHFVKPRLSTSAFGIRHYAGVVLYEGRGFVDKNVDSVCTEHIALINTSECQLIAQLFQGSHTSSKPSGPALGRKRNGAISRPTVGSQFRESLKELMSTLNSTSPNYIRCIKPNDDKMPFVFDPQRAVQQLRACGVLETIRISAAGFPSRLLYQDFFDRYCMLLPSGQVRRDDVQQMCEYIVLRTIQGTDKYCFGRTKVFFRAGEVAYLERLRSNKLHSAGILIQKHVLGWLQRNRYMKFRKATILVQARARGLLARRLADHLRQTRAAIRLQANFRCFVQRRSFQRLRKLTVFLQSCYRGQLARRELTRCRQEAKATIIQRYVRGWLARVAFRHAFKQVVLVQCSVRCWLARRELRKLRLEARSVTHLRNLNHGLEAKIIELQMKLTDKITVNEELENRCRSLERQLANAQLGAGERVRKLETQLTDSTHSHQQTVRSLEQRVKELEGQLASCSCHESSVRTLEERVSELVREVEAERERRRCLEEELSKARQEPQPTPGDHCQGGEWGSAPTPIGLDPEAPIPSSTYSDAKERVELEHELAGVRERYQKTLNLYSALEGQFAQLQKELQGKWTRNFELSSLSLTHVNGSVLSSPPTRQSPPTNPRIAKLRLATSTPAAPQSFDTDSLDGIMLHSGDKTGAVLSAMKDRIARLEEDKACLEKKMSLVSQDAPRRDTNKSLEQPLKGEGKGGVVSMERFQSLEKVKTSLISDVARMKEALQQSSSASVLNLTLQHEVTRLADENLDLMERLEALQRQSVRVRGGGPMSPRRRLNPCSAASPEKPRPIRFKGYQTELKPSDGIIPWRSEYLPKILRTLVLELAPESLKGKEPCLPAHVIFMCLQYPGQAGDQDMADQLMKGVASAIQQVTQNCRSLQYLAFWLANTMRLVTLLWQYSTEDQTVSTSTVPSISSTFSSLHYSLLAVNTSTHLQALTHVATTLYGQVVHIAQAQIQPLVVSGILEHEAIRGLSSSCPIGFRRLGSPEVTVSTIVHKLTTIWDTLEGNGVSPEVVGLAMKQLFYVIGAYSLNNLLLRKDMCHWSRGMQIRYNLSQLEDWVHTRGLGWVGLVDQLQPVIQAAKLLQMKKSSQDDAAAIIELCTHLNPLQVQKILTMYNPVNEYEERVPVSVIRLVAQKGRGDQTDPTHLMADVNHCFPMELPYSPAGISFHSIAIPPSLLRLELTA